MMRSQRAEMRLPAHSTILHRIEWSRRAISQFLHASTLAIAQKFCLTSKAANRIERITARGA
jgi:hypothetical protein